MQLETLISISFGAWLANATETERATVYPLARDPARLMVRGEAAIPS
jgi:hypothetical protein